MPRNHIFTKTNCWRFFLTTFLVSCLSISPLCVSAQSDGDRVYTEENPLVYEDALNLWPYAFKGDDGKPAGYNIDLVEQLLATSKHIRQISPLDCPQDSVSYQC